MTPREPFALTLCLRIVRLFGWLVPATSRDSWRREWDAEVRYRWHLLQGRQRLDWRAKMDLIGRVLGALPDAAWLRRQFTADAEVVHDVRHGFRMLRKSPAFTASAVFILGLGIAGTVSISSVLDTLILRPLPYANADRVVTLWQRHIARGQVREDVSPANFLDWRERAQSFEAMAGVIPYSFDYTGGGEPEVFFGAQVTAGFWDALGVRLALGRGFLPEEHVPGGRRSIVISYALWQRKFGSDPSIVSRAISLDGEPWTVVGVLPKDFAPQLMPRPGELSVWTPKIVQDHERRTRGSAWWHVVARLKPGVTVEQAQRELDTISIALGREYPRTNEGLSASVVPLRDHLMGGLKVPLFVMLGAVLVVLATGCVNVASLLLARGMQREREFAIRAALGAGRARMVRQLVAESLLLSVLSAVCGVVAATWALRVIVALAPGGVVRLHDAAIDGRMMWLAAVVTTLTAVAFGLVPALQFSRPSRDIVRERMSTGGRVFLRRGLVAAEIAFALVLMTGAGLLIRSFMRLMSVDPGFSSAGVVAVQVFASERNGKPDRTRAFFSATLDRMRAIPGVEAAGAVSTMPFMMANIDIKTPLTIVGRAMSEADRSGTYVTIATAGYFEAMSILLREGRYIEAGDTERAPRIGVISEALRRREWPSESPLGRRIRVEWEGKPIELEIVGVVSQIRHDSLDGPARAEVFVPLPQLPFASMTYVVRGKGDPADVIAAVKREVWTIDPLQTFYDVATVKGLVDASVVRQRFSMTLLSGFAGLALLLCASGVYGLISFTTLQRTREIGVRMALGADRGAIRGMVLKDGGLLVALGLGLGLAGAIAVSRVLQTMLFEIRPEDPLTLLFVSVLIGSVGLAACYLPARRATRVDPLVALRGD